MQPYDPVIRHEPARTGTWLCRPCSYSTINTLCGHTQCGCACMVETLAQRDDPSRWHEPPNPPEPLDSWIPSFEPVRPIDPLTPINRLSQARLVAEEESRGHTEPMTLLQRIRRWWG